MKWTDEAALLARCQQGEARAWDEFFDRYYGPVGRFVFQWSPEFTREDTEEICQEAFLSAVQNLRSFRGKSQVQTWLFRIAANKAKDFRERRTAAKRGSGQTPVSLQAEDPETGQTPDPPSDNPGPDTTLMDAERRSWVRAALDRLGPPCQELIELRYFADLSYEELAEAQKLNPKTVSSRLSRCLDRLAGIVREIASREKNTKYSV